MIVSFLYRIQGNPRLFYGKYIGYISDDYDDGLDGEIRNRIFPILQEHCGIETEEDILIAVMGYSREGYDYFSEKEKDILDLLYCHWSNQPSEIYLYGQAIHISA